MTYFTLLFCITVSIASLLWLVRGQVEITRLIIAVIAVSLVVVLMRGPVDKLTRRWP